MREQRWREEAQFFDAVAASHASAVGAVDRRTLARYASPSLRRRFGVEFRLRVLGGLAGKRVLDVGCGEGQESVLLALLGAREVVGLDISPGAIALAEQRARDNGVADKVRFLCGSVEKADIPPDSFDVVWCNALLHHVLDDLDAVMRNLTRWAALDGIVTLAEPVNLNPTLRRFRQSLPIKTEATPGERPLEARDLAVVRRYIPELEVRHFGLLGRLDRYVLENYSYERSSLPRRLFANATAVADWVLLSLPGFETMGSTSVMWGRPNKLLEYAERLAVVERFAAAAAGGERSPAP